MIELLDLAEMQVTDMTRQQMDRYDELLTLIEEDGLHITFSNGKAHLSIFIEERDL